jgi:pimeloyl-ACP methyl ester carboxylesterase
VLVAGFTAAATSWALQGDALVAAGFRAIAVDRRSHGAGRADVPVLMIAGRESQFWPCQHAAATVRDNPLGRSVVIDDCGHGVNFDQSDAFNDQLPAFVRDR